MNSVPNIKKQGKKHHEKLLVPCARQVFSANDMELENLGRLIVSNVIRNFCVRSTVMDKHAKKYVLTATLNFCVLYTAMGSGYGTHARIAIWVQQEGRAFAKAVVDGRTTEHECQNLTLMVFM